MSEASGPSWLRNWKPELALGLWLLPLLLLGFIEGLTLDLRTQEEGLRDGAFQLWIVGWAWLLCRWSLRNGAKQVFDRLFEVDSLIFFFWPCLVPWLLVKTRGWWVMFAAVAVAVCAMLSLYLGGLVAGLIVAEFAGV